MATLKTIDRVNINQLSEPEFNRLYLSGNKPVVITNLFDSIPSLSGWTPENLAKKIGNKMIEVYKSKNGIFAADPTGDDESMLPVSMGFMDFIQQMNSPQNTVKLYMQQLPLHETFPELSESFKLPDLVLPEKIMEVNLWVGPGGNTSQLHYDANNNFLMQLHGSKKITLYHPMDFYNLYPNSCFSLAGHCSKAIDLSDLKKYPKISKAVAMEATIGPGELLFIPTYWWHLVHSVDTAVSVNVWWENRLKQYFAPAALHNFIFFRYSRYKRWKKKSA